MMNSKGRSDEAIKAGSKNAVVLINHCWLI